MSWAFEKHGKEYHWLLRLYEKLNLPLFEGMTDEILRSNSKHVSDQKQKKKKKDWTVQE